MHVACYNLRRLLLRLMINPVLFSTCVLPHVHKRDPRHGNHTSSFEQLKTHHLHNRVTSNQAIRVCLSRHQIHRQ